MSKNIELVMRLGGWVNILKDNSRGVSIYGEAVADLIDLLNAVSRALLDRPSPREVGTTIPASPDQVRESAKRMFEKHRKSLEKLAAHDYTIPASPEWGVMSACESCVTKTHCDHWRRCLMECTPQELGLSQGAIPSSPPAALVQQWRAMAPSLTDRAADQVRQCANELERALASHGTR